MLCSVVAGFAVLLQVVPCCYMLYSVLTGRAVLLPVDTGYYMLCLFVHCCCLLL